MTHYVTVAKLPVGTVVACRLETGRRTVLISARGFQDAAPQTVNLSPAGAVVDLDLVLQPATA